MPGFDGTGPRGSGPFTGGGRGYCALRLPNPESGETVSGYAGIQGMPVSVVPRPALRPHSRRPCCPALAAGARADGAVDVKGVCAAGGRIRDG